MIDPPEDLQAVLDWTRPLPRGTRVALGVVALACSLETVPNLCVAVMGLRSTPACIRTEVGVAIDLACRFLVEGELGADERERALTLADECHEFVPPPEMTIDGRLAVVIAIGCLMFTITETSPADVDVNRIQPDVVLYHTLQPMWEVERDAPAAGGGMHVGEPRTPTQELWWQRIQTVFPIRDLATPIEFTDAWRQRWTGVATHDCVVHPGRD